MLKGPLAPHESTEGGSTVNDESPQSTLHEKETPSEEPPAEIEVNESQNTTHKEETPTEVLLATETSSTLFDLASQSMQGLDLLAELRGKYELDPTLQPIIARPKDFRNFEVDEQLIYLKTQGKQVLCIPKVVIQGRSAHEIVISEAHSLLAHLGAGKTLDYLRDHCWWKVWWQMCKHSARCATRAGLVIPVTRSRMAS